MKHIYFIRHAPTIVDQTGEMIKDYRKININPLSKNEMYLWFNNVGRYIKKFNRVYISNTTRAYETSQLLMNSKEIIVDDTLNEIDCSGLEHKKFWEISEDEFNELLKDKINLEEFDEKVKRFINKLLNLNENDEDDENEENKENEENGNLNKLNKNEHKKLNEENKLNKNENLNKYENENEHKSNSNLNENIVCITHGLFIRHLYHLLTNNAADTLYKQINSVDFRFDPLDMLEVIYCEKLNKNKSIFSIPQKIYKSLGFSKKYESNDFGKYKIKDIKIYRYHE